MTLRRKLLLTFLTVLVLVGIQAVTAVVLLTQLVDGSAQLVQPALGRVDAVAHLESDVLRLHVLQHTLLEGASAIPEADIRLEMDQLRTQIDARSQAYRRQNLDEARTRLLDSIQQQYAGFLAVQTQVNQLDQQGDHAGAVQQYQNAEPDFVTLDNQIHQLRHLEYAVIQQLHDQLVATAELARWPLAVVVVLVAAAELALGWSLSRGIIRSLTLLRNGARRIAQESCVEPIPSPPEPEFAELAATLNEVMVELAANRAAHTRLEAERSRLQRERLGHVVRIQEEERARISRELHDQAGQALTALKYGLDHLKRAYREPGARDEVGQLIELASETGRQIGALARDLRPAVLDDLGIVAALRGYSREYSERVGIPVEVSAPVPIPRLGHDAETAIFRVAQEAFTNVAKHAQASHIWLDITRLDERLEVQVRDDGRGFAANRLDIGNHVGLGLAGIQERVQLLGGDLEVQSEPGHGTSILVSLPIPHMRESVETRPRELAVA